MLKLISRLAVAATLACLAMPAFAQDPGASREQVQAARALVREGARQIVMEELTLTPEQGEKFWPLYDRYRAEMLAVEDRYVDVVRDFLQKYYDYKLTDDDANAIVDQYFDIESETLKIRKKYLRQFRRLMPPMQVMRLYQIENKVQAEIDAALALAVPLAEGG
jgi:Spy/CpxP family protein refolding chaperone